MSRTSTRAVLIAAAIAALFLGAAGTSIAAPQPVAELNLTGQGLALADGGIGLGGDPGPPVFPQSVDVQVGGPVQAAILYWGGFMNDQTTFPGDSELIFGGTPIAGALIGTENIDDGPLLSRAFGFRADVTSIVQAAGVGALSFLIEDGNAMDNADRLAGAGLVVLYTDPAETRFFQVVALETVDYAYDRFTGTPAGETDPMVFDYASDVVDRPADLLIFNGGGQAPRGERLDVSSNPSIFDSSDSSDGDQWDTDRFGITIPNGASSTTVRFFSVDTAVGPSDSLLWLLGALRIPQPEEALGCRFTGGGVDTDGNWNHELEDGQMVRNGAGNLPAGIDRYQFGGQAGANTALPPQPSGEWTHSNQRGPSGGFTFHGGTHSAPAGTEIDAIRCSDPGACLQARQAPAKQLDFDGIGTFRSIGNGSRAPVWAIPNANVTAEGNGNQSFDGTFHWFQVNVDDLGEPGGFNGGAPDSVTCPSTGFGENGTTPLADCSCPDFYRIKIYDGVDAANVVWNPDGSIDPTSLDRTHVIYEVYGYIDGGNLQIHPLTGFDR